MLNVVLHVELLPWPVYVAVKAAVVTAWLTSPGDAGAGSVTASSVQALVIRASESRTRIGGVMAGLLSCGGGRRRVRSGRAAGRSGPRRDRRADMTTETLRFLKFRSSCAPVGSTLAWPQQ